MSVFAPTLGALWRQLESYGIQPEALFRENGIDPDVLFDQGARVATTKLLKLNQQAVEASGDSFFGLKSAEYFRPAHLGALGFAWLASADLRTAFERLGRYSRVIHQNLAVELAEDEHHFHVTVTTDLEVPYPAVQEDGHVAKIMKISRIIAGPELNASTIRFMQPEPADTGRHYQIFRCPLEFGASTTRLSFDLEDVEVRLLGSNDELAQLNEHIVIRYLAHAEKADIVNRTKTLIIDGLANGAVTETLIADQLHMTPRNLHRKLQKEDTSFKQVLTDVRKDLAQQYIKDRSKTLTEISFLLGFSEVSSFSRAYKGWTGKPPSEVRGEAR